MLGLVVCGICPLISSRFSLFFPPIPGYTSHHIMDTKELGSKLWHWLGGAFSLDGGEGDKVGVFSILLQLHIW
ncbi:hypothetical protein GE21DRAFT_1119349 [Neurospora crassa]|nr:hypothetical protein GE21DRAFT_1119349 [Neurospora crassa]